MVCRRCVIAVEQILKSSQISFVSVQLGEVILDSTLNASQMKVFSEKLQENGFEWLDDRNHKIIEKIKTLLIKKIANLSIEEHFSLTEYLTQKMQRDYSGMSQLFSQVSGITIEQFFICQKIEKVKELLSYQELTLSEIAWQLGYKSVQHLSTQFKKITGMTPTNFKKLKNKPRTAIDKVGDFPKR